MNGDCTTEEYSSWAALQATRLIFCTTDSSDPDTTFPPSSILQRVRVSASLYWLTKPLHWQMEERSSCRILHSKDWSGLGLEAPGGSLHMSSVADYFIRTLCALRAICFQVSLNGIREKYPQVIIFKGDFKCSPRKKKYSTFELQEVAQEILPISKTEKRVIFSVSG